MAKDKYDDVDQIDDDFDFDDFNMDDDPDTSPKTDTDRSPVARAKTQATKAVKKAVKSEADIENVVQKTLPKNMVQTINMGYEIQGKASDLYNDLAEDAKPVIRDLKKTARMINKRIGGILPKKLQDKIDELTADESTSERNAEISREEMETAKIQKEQQEIFEVQLQQNKEAIDNQLTATLMGKKASDEQTHLLKYMAGIVGQLGQYQNTIGLNFQKKQMEIQYRQLFAQQSILERMRVDNEVIKQNLVDITKNTALPDILKEHKGELAQNMLLRRTFDLMQTKSGISEKLAGVIDGFFGNIRKKGKEFIGGIRTGLDHASAMTDVLESADEMGGSDTLLYNMAAAEGVGWLGTKLGNQVRNVLMKNDQIANLDKLSGVFNDNFPSMVLNARDGLKSKQKALADAREAKNLAEGRNKKFSIKETGLGILADLIPSVSENTGSIGFDNHQNLLERAEFDNSTRRTINDIIPGYLARILQSTEGIRTGTISPLQVFDQASGKFTDSISLQSKVKEAIYGKETKSLEENLEKFTNVLVNDRQISDDARKAIKLKALKIARTGKTLNIKDFYNGVEGIEDDQLAIIREEIEKNFTKEEMNSKASLKSLWNTAKSNEKTDQISKFSSLSGALIKSIPDVLFNARKQANGGQQYIEALREMGIISEKDDGNQINLDNYYHNLIHNPSVAPFSSTLAANNVTKIPFQPPQPEQRIVEEKRVLEIPNLKEIIEAQTEAEKLNREIQMLKLLKAIGQQTTIVENGLEEIIELIPSIGSLSVNEGNLGKEEEEEETGKGFFGRLRLRRKRRKKEKEARLAKNLVFFGSSSLALSKLTGGLFKGGIKTSEIISSLGKKIFKFPFKTARTAFNSASQIIGGIFNDRMDIYVHGESIPRLFKSKMKAGLYFNRLTGKPVTRLSDIKDDVIDEEGNIILTTEEIARGLYNAKGKRIKATFLNKIGAAIRRGSGLLMDGLTKGLSTAAGLPLKAFNITRKWLTTGMSTIGRFVERDIYLGDEKHPRIRKFDLLLGKYHDSDGKPIKSFKDIKTDVYDKDGNIVLSLKEVQEKGIFDVHGNPLKGLFGRLLDSAKIPFKAATTFVRTGLKAAGAALGTVANIAHAATSFITGNPIRTGNTGGRAHGLFESAQTRWTKMIYEILAWKFGGVPDSHKNMPEQNEQSIFNSVRNFNFRSFFSKFRKKKDDKEKTNEDKEDSRLERLKTRLLKPFRRFIKDKPDNPEEKKDSKLSGLFSTLRAWLGVDATAEDGAEMDEKSIKARIKKLSPQSVKQLFTKKGLSNWLAKIRKKKVSETEEDSDSVIRKKLSLKRVFDRKAADGSILDPETGQRRKGSWRDWIENRNKKKDKPDNPEEKKDSKLSGLFSKFFGKGSLLMAGVGLIGSVLGNIVGKIGDMFGWFSKKTGLTKLLSSSILKIGRFLKNGVVTAAKATWNAASKVTRSIFQKTGLNTAKNAATKTAAKAGAKTAAKAAAKTSVKAAMNTAAKVATRTVARTALTTGARMIASTALRVLAGPVGWALLIAEAGYLAYKAYRWFKSDLDPFEKLRVGLYGFDYSEDNELANKLLGFERELMDKVKLGSDKQTYLIDDIDYDRWARFFIHEDDEALFKEDAEAYTQHVSNFTTWYEYRFKPAFLNNLTQTYKVDPKLELQDIDDDLEDGLKPSLAKRLYLKGNDLFLTDILPFSNFPDSNISEEEVKALADEIIGEHEDDEATLRQEEKEAESGARTWYGAKKTKKGYFDFENREKQLQSGAKIHQQYNSANLLAGAGDKVAIPNAKGVTQTYTIEQVRLKGGLERISDLRAIRMRTYGLGLLQPTYVNVLLSMEDEFIHHVTPMSNGKLKVDEINYRKWFENYAVHFGLDINAMEDEVSWIKWFKLRFIEVFLVYYGTAKQLDGGVAFENIEDYFKIDKLIAIAEAMVQHRVTFGTTTLRIWDIHDVFIKDVKTNVDAGSVLNNLDNMKNKQNNSRLLEESMTKVQNKEREDMKKFANTEFGSIVKQQAKPVYGDDTKIGGVAGVALGTAQSVGVNQSGQLTVGGVAPGQPYDYGAGNEMGVGEGGNISGMPEIKGQFTKNPHHNFDLILPSLKKASQMTGVPLDILIGIAKQESNFNGGAKAGTSSAKGIYQFVKGTWEHMVDKHGKTYGIDKTFSPLNANANILMGAEFIKENLNDLKKSGVIKGRNPNAVDGYMAHFLGAGGARKFLKAMNENPQAAGVTGVSPAAAKANYNVFHHQGGKQRTLAEVYNWMGDKTRGSGVRPFFEKAGIKLDERGNVIDNSVVPKTEDGVATQSLGEVSTNNPYINEAAIGGTATPNIDIPNTSSGMTSNAQATNTGQKTIDNVTSKTQSSSLPSPSAGTAYTDPALRQLNVGNTDLVANSEQVKSAAKEVNDAKQRLGKTEPTVTYENEVSNQMAKHEAKKTTVKKVDSKKEDAKQLDQYTKIQAQGMKVTEDLLGEQLKVQQTMAKSLANIEAKIEQMLKDKAKAAQQDFRGDSRMPQNARHAPYDVSPQKYRH